MPRLIDYPTVLQTMTAAGCRCVYYNAGAFTPGRQDEIGITGWIGPDDPTIRLDLPAAIERVEPPYGANLSEKLAAAWLADYAGPAWVMPASHWAYELDFGSVAWLPAALREVGIDPAVLKLFTRADALEFQPTDRAAFVGFVTALLDQLAASDFTVVFPGRRAVVTLHHHKQVWWQVVAFDSSRQPTG